ncbi:dimethylsulfonioproprionate lyase family protein [Marivivens marinus]|uniref:dimethylsulfonioproprionate lyase family protein n=1 Tax=Marivivens marinus TaxID=3110173 RepID=UPI003B84A2BE
MAYQPRFTALLDELAAVYRAEGRSEGATAANALTQTAIDMPVTPSACAFDLGIRTCLAGSDHPAARAALATHDLIDWSVNPVQDQMTAAAAAIIAVATLMGPDGPIPCPDHRLGLVYMAPNSYYGLHNHDADETYVILAGSALWTAGDDTRHRPAGDMIHHPSLMPHAFRTGPEGFVALWRWSGDINTHSYRFLPDPQVEAQA